MQGFVFNTRKDLFKDRRVRRALTLAMNFEWSNSKLFYGQYVRNESYFSNSELASKGLPQGKELALLEPFKDQLPEEVFTKVWQPPQRPDHHHCEKISVRPKNCWQRQAGKLKMGFYVMHKVRHLNLTLCLFRRALKESWRPLRITLGSWVSK